ncbi:MAG: hypothetical protein PSY12_05900 [bacterium]|nr:hypothetical protein [bacterium]
MSLALAACGDRAPVVGNAVDATLVDADDGKADCVIGANAAWARTCLIERGTDMLTLRHPDGGFRRFRIVSDGRGLVPADGAEQAKLSILGDRQIEVSVGVDRYRLPATIAGPGR